ncbi:MAG: oligoribonuclease, partial [Brevibacterium linens]
MTGLDEVRDELIEVAAIVTDFELNPLDEGIDIVIRPSADARANMNEFVTNMHTTSGLITELDAGTTAAEAQAKVLEYVKKHVPEAGKALLGGNSVGTDKVFLTKQMPELVDYLHYRIIDVSSIKELSKQWFPRAYFQAPAKHGNHRALGDIIDSIIELQYYRKAVFSAEGPSS